MNACKLRSDGSKTSLLIDDQGSTGGWGAIQLFLSGAELRGEAGLSLARIGRTVLNVLKSVKGQVYALIQNLPSSRGKATFHLQHKCQISDVSPSGLF
jgi:hypothetical protein